MRCTTPSRSRVTIGASPIDSSSSSKRRGPAISARASATICCSPPDSVPPVCRSRVAHRREHLEHGVEALLARADGARGTGRRRSTGSPRPTSVGKIERPPLISVIPSLTRCSGRHTGEVEPVVEHAALAPLDQPGDGVQQRRLADPVAADEGVHPSVRDPHRRPEQDLDRSVRHVELLDRQQVAALLDRRPGAGQPDRGLTERLALAPIVIVGSRRRRNHRRRLRRRNRALRRGSSRRSRRSSRT